MIVNQQTQEKPPDSNAQAWSPGLLRNPHEVGDKAARVRNMFSAIAQSYDRNNRLHSLWRDQAWRRKAVRMCDLKGDEHVVDIACGTGDLTLRFAHAGAERVIGIDFTPEMLFVGSTKMKADPKQNKAHITLTGGDAMRLPLRDASADIVSIAFGIRNVSNAQRAITEFARVLREGGKLVILEFSLPRNPVMRALYQAYFQHVLPRTATWISGDKTGAYKYLPRSVDTFVDGVGLVSMMQTAGLHLIRRKSLTLGVAAVYVAEKRAAPPATENW